MTTIMMMSARRSIAIAHRGIILARRTPQHHGANNVNSALTTMMMMPSHAVIPSTTADAIVPANLLPLVICAHTNNNMNLHIHIRHHSASITATAASSATASFAAASSRGGNDGIGNGGNGDGGREDFGMAGKIFFSSLCLFTFGLGVWQTQRYFEKVDMVQKRQEDLTLEPLGSYYDWAAAAAADSTATTTTSTTNDRKTKETIVESDDNAKPSKKSYRRVHLRGTFQHEHEIFIGPRGPPPGALAESGPNSGRGGGGGGMSSSTQGYIVVTPFVIKKDGGEEHETRSKKHSGTMKQTKKEEEEENVVVWVNRGWIPRHFLNHPNSHYLHHHHGPQPHNYNEIITSYSQPTGTIQLLAMESNTDTPGRFAPPSRVMPSSHRAESKIQTIIEGDASTNNNASNQDASSSTATAMYHKKLLWMDRPAMEELTSSQPPNQHPPLFVEINTSTDTNNNSSVLQYPVKSTQEYVGEFKVTPEIHAAYAITWFGLSGAGVLMTKKLLSRGRL